MAQQAECTVFGYPPDCLSLYDGGERNDGVYVIRPDGQTSVNAFCDMSNGGWTVFQSHANGDVDLATASWSEMLAGLGSPTGDHWLGLTYIHLLTWRDSLIYFDLVLLNGSQIYFQYSNFSVGNSSTMFKMTVGEGYQSNAYSYVEYEGFYQHDLMKFTAVDKDNDMYYANCALSYGPWWHRNCGIFGSFNGNFHDMNFWNVPGEGRVYVKKTMIKLRRR
ncbi:fibrinogen-like protein A [Argopecten irradians]|uniref:fibrinogen-like protein A n=1 Tax=Argopecten irradians TaxID=31199 RepID=UPI0037131283